MKTIRSLSGIYFRYQNPETKEWENIVFEDLPEEWQDKYMNEKSVEFIKGLAKQLANTINIIGEQFDIIRDYEGKNERRSLISIENEKK